jgi:hypothetical protein
MIIPSTDLNKAKYGQHNETTYQNNCWQSFCEHDCMKSAKDRIKSGNDNENYGTRLKTYSQKRFEYNAAPAKIVTETFAIT